MNNQKGFTLIELMVSVLVASVIMLAMGSMLISGMRSNQVSEHRLDAAAIAQSVLANISVRSAVVGYTQATAQNDAAAQLVNLPRFTPIVTLVPATTVQGSVTLTVQLGWNEHNVAKNVVLTTQVLVP